MKGSRIKYQLRGTALIPVFLVAILFAVVYNRQYNNDLEQHIAHLGEAYIRQLLPAVQLAMMRQDHRTLQGLINASTINPDITALTFYNAAGQLVAYRGGKYSISKPFTPPAFTGDYIISKKINTYTINFIAPIIVPQFNLYSKRPGTINKTRITAGDDILGWLSINIDTRSMLIKRYQLYIITIFITLIGLITSLTVHYFFSRRIYIPIIRLKRSMKQILSNEFETHISVSSPGELGIIEQGCAHLQKQHLDTIHDLNHHIEVATADLQQSLELLEEKNIELSLETKKAKEKSRQKSEFIANMSHEIRTPMNGVLGFTNVLLETKLDTLQLDYAKTIKSSAQDLLNIINDILDYSKMDAGKLHLDCIPVDVRSCIDEVLTLSSPVAHKKGVDLIPSTSLSVPKTLLGDPLRIKQILTNIINNAIKFTDQGYILVSTTLAEESEKNCILSINVEDTGIGISPQDQKKLFNAFNQADTSITRRFGGTGLGLVICKKLTEAMQGTITIVSELNKGSKVTININLEKSAAYEVEKYQTQRFNYLKAICFDGNSLQLEAMCNGIGYLGIECFPIKNFNFLAEAFRTYTQCNIAFISIPEGYEKQISAILKQQTIPCILVSKWLIHQPESLGAKAFLFKPISIQKLQNTIALLVEHGPHPKPEDTRLENLRKKLNALHPDILIAEDNPVNRMLLTSLLGEFTQSNLVINGEEAVEACSKKKYHIILLDLQMPKLNGLEAARQIRNNLGLNKHTPIILISANFNEITQQQILREGFNTCLQKPIDEKDLLTELLMLLDESPNGSIDWPLCLQKFSGNHALAKDYLNQFVQELKSEHPNFLKLFQENKIKELAFAAHKLYGACCFCGVPHLQKWVAELEKMAETATNVHELKEIFLEFIQSAEDVQKEFSNFYC